VPTVTEWRRRGEEEKRRGEKHIAPLLKYVKI